LIDGKDDLGSKSQAIFDVHSYEGACGKSRRVRQLRQNVVSVANDLVTIVIQINTSTKPSSGARFLFPREIKILRRVPKLTSVTRAKNTVNGNTNQIYRLESKKAILSSIPSVILIHWYTLRSTHPIQISKLS
jgi:hypothetical protein